MTARTIRIGEGEPHVALEVLGYAHPEVAEPEGMDLLDCRVHAAAPPVTAVFPVLIRVDELRDLAAYLEQINSGNGPPSDFSLAGGLFELSFVPSRRGPVLCAVRLKSIEQAHARLEYLVTLEPETITRLLRDFSPFDSP
jgi:hypothetical protein